MKKIILLDMDGTINEFTIPFIKGVENLGYSFDHKGYNDWHIENFIRGATNTRVIMEFIFSDVDFWNNLPPKPGAKEVLRELSKEYEIKIVTYIWKREFKYIKAKKDWVNKHFHFLKNNEFILESEKWKLTGDIIIDDKPKILQMCQGGKITICSDAAYNKDIECDYRFKNWNQMPGIMRSIERERGRK